MIEKELLALQPSEQTGPEIRASLARIEAAKQSLKSRLADNRADMTERERTFSLSSAIRRKLVDTIDDLEMDIKMLDALTAEITAPLEKIELLERDQRLGKERIALQAEMVALDEIWNAEYPAIQTSMRKMLSDRRELLSRIYAHHDLTRNIFNPIGLEAFRLPTDEIQLLKTRAQRDHDDTPEWLHQIRTQAEADAARSAARAARAPIVFDEAPSKPTLTVAGVPVAMPGRGW